MELQKTDIGRGSLEEVLAHTARGIQGGRHWYEALLEAAQLWTSPEEVVDGNLQRYLIGNEALDWPILARRLCQEMDGLIPAAEKERFLKTGKAPVELPQALLRDLMGSIKYRAVLNYFYGVQVEGALLESVAGDVMKEQLSRGYADPRRARREAYHRIYGCSGEALRQQFRGETSTARSSLPPATEAKEFTYWLFKYRLKTCDKARVASDTRRALAFLHQGGQRMFP